MNSFNIRKLKKSDLKIIFTKGYNFFPKYLTQIPSLKVKIFEIINRILGHKNEKFTIVMEKDGDILGVLTYFNFDNKIWITGPLFVAHNARRMGVGRKLVSFANDILREKGIHKAYGDVPLNNPAKYLHTKLGCHFFDFTFVIEINKNTSISQTSDKNNNSFRDLNKNIGLFENIKNVLSEDVINFFNISNDNYYYPFNSDLRKISRIFFKKIKYLIHNNTIVLLNELRFKPLLDISIYLYSIDDLDFILDRMLNYMKIGALPGRLFFRQSINYEKIQRTLKKRNITNHIDEIMVYFL